MTAGAPPASLRDLPLDQPPRPDAASPQPREAAPQRPLRGVALVALATLAFALSDVVTKQQAALHPPVVVVAVRYLVNLGLLALLLGPRLGAGLWQVRRQGLVLARGLVLCGASLTMALALRVMPVGEAIAISYLAPFLVMLLAAPLLGERVGTAGWAGAGLGFLGVLLIARPGGELDPAGVAFALANAVCAAGYAMLTRFLRAEATAALLFQTAVTGSVVFGILALPALPGLRLPLGDLAMIGLLGALSTLGHFLFTAAFREAPASLLAPVNYAHLTWAGCLGWLVFGHVPTAWSLAGIALVCASGALVAARAWIGGGGRG